ncbi:helix-turn-helix domain-containing protein [Luteibacter aegosomaticola]|uniref:PucR family transcriptional regulator n=1 Tax=Luteibacter aegosomaticola TaxID=2911538 RepID=UPI001FFBF83F|nr:helix-turn-helix domain-containing protein [Luteibacter aegosomaticola]UPG88192.1 helix-turn-helix domain-containing protein [Luteibacter aegosomaticola]
MTFMTTPRLHGHLVALGQQLARDPSHIVARLNERLEATEPGYAALPAHVKQDVREFMHFSAHVWFRTVLDGLPPTDSDWATVDACARRRVHQGVSLGAVLHACRLGSRELWVELLNTADQPSERNALLDAFSVYLLDYFDDLAQRIASAFLDEQFQRARWRDALRHQLLNVILSFPDDELAFRHAATALGLEAAAPYACLALDMMLPDTPPSHLEGELDRLLLAVSRAVALPADAMVRALYRDRLVIWMPALRGDSVLAADKSMRQRALLLQKALPGIRRIGIGLANAGPHGWAESLAEACRALQGAASTEVPQMVFSYADIVLNESVMRSPAALRYLDAVVERLSHDPDLLLTLSTFLHEGQHRKRTSQQLDIHPNTLNYRLARIEEILGASLSDAAWLARLQVALSLRQASDPTARWNPAPPGD